MPEWFDSTYFTSISTKLYTPDGFSDVNRSQPYPYDFQFNALHFINGKHGQFASDFQGFFNWFYYDEQNDAFSVTKDTTVYSCYSDFSELLPLKNGSAAFTFHQTKGYELVGLSADSAFVLQDIFPGLSSYQDKFDLIIKTRYIVRDGIVYFQATHPIFGKVIYKSDGTKAGTGLLAKLPFGKEFSGVPLHVHDNDLFIFHNDKVYKIDIDAPFKDEKPPYLNASNFWNQRVVGKMETYCESHPSSGIAYDPMHAQKKGGLVMMQTNGVNSKRFFLPDAEIVADKHPYRWSTSVAIFDTNGQPVFHTSLSGNSSLSKAALGPNNTMVTAVRHLEESYNGFESFGYSQNQHIVAKYTFNGTKHWQVNLPVNFIFINLVVDDIGNTYLTGSYSGGSLELNNDFSLVSTFGGQYFMLKISEAGEIVWAKNLPMEGITRHSSKFGYIAFSNDGNTIYQLISDGTSNVGSTCNYQSWNSKLNAINANNGNINWIADLKTSDIAIFTDVTVSEIGDVWVSGGFRGTFIPALGNSIKAQGEADCPTSAVLLRYNGLDGSLKSVMTKPNGRYNSVTAKNNHVYSAFTSATTEFQGINLYNKAIVMTIEKRELSGRLLARYESPVLFNRSSYSIGMKVFPEINSNDDWLLFTYNLNDYIWKGLISDTLFIPNQNVESLLNNTLLMRRPGSIFKTIEEENPVSWQGEKYVVYPNPNRFNEIFVNGTSGVALFTSYQLVALDGSVIAQGSVEQAQWPIYIKFSQDLQGLYILRMIGAEESKSFKIVFY